MGSNWSSQVARYYQTMRYMKPRQLWCMRRYRLLPRRFCDSRDAWSGKLHLRKNINHSATFESPVPHCDNIVSDKGEFTFLHKAVPLGWPPNWRRADEEDRLWCYNLHYHDFVWGLPFEKARNLVESWIDSCRFQHGAASWSPYPISVRLGNWLKYFLCVHGERGEAEVAFTEKLLKSVAAQTVWLLKNIEIHLLGNHLLENAVALCFVGMCLDGPLAKACARYGLDLLQHEVNEQILPDGGHFERSPMYHSRCLYLLADLYNLGMGRIMPQLEDHLRRMWSWLRLMCHPDGQIALFNDAAHNVYLSPDCLSGYLSKLLQKGLPCASGAFSLSESGYFGWCGPDGEYVVCDAGAIGPDYQPGHAHADLFSFELSLNGQRVIVDSGTATYCAGDEREYLRGTAAHNTAEVNGQNQVDVWGSFRVGRRVRPRNVDFSSSPTGFALSAAHEGYRHDFGISHRRVFVFRKNRDLRITDAFDGLSSQCVRMRLHLAPGCSVTSTGEGHVVKSQAASLKIALNGYAAVGIEELPVSRELGRRQAAQCLVFSLRKGATGGDITISW